MTKAIIAEEKTHASLGASSASRWMNCPGSVALTETMPAPPSSIHAQAGTAAHALAETCLRRGQDPHTFIGASFEGVTVDEEMADAVKMYVDYCRALRDRYFPPGSVEFIEKRFNLSALKPPVPMYGTTDHALYAAVSHKLYVTDFKFGQGVVVDVEENPQLMYYALGALLSLDLGTQVDEIILTVVQPRAAHSDGPIRTFTMTPTDLLGFAGELLNAARATLAPDAPLHAGSWCRWCAASGNCSEQLKHAQLVAQSEFAAEVVKLPQPGALEPEVFSNILGKLHILEDWASAMRAHAQAKLERGEDVPGWKLVNKRATRKWGDEKDVIDWLKAKGFTEEEFAILKVKSPAQIEKLVGKKNLPPEFVTSESSGLNMVPSTDPREEVRMVTGQEFSLLPSGK